MDNILEYSRYNNPQVRALVWSLISPALAIKSDDFPACVTPQWCQEIYQQLQPFFEQLDNNPTPLTQWLEQQKSRRLGIRFEVFWSFILKQLQQQNELLAYTDHIQIHEQALNHRLQKDLKTVGEMDFVYLNNNKQLNHLEIAVKFYLFKPDEIGYARLVGPNGSDWYERKLLHLFNKQLVLSTTQDAKEKLAEHFQLNTEQVQCQQQGLIKGMLFFPVTGEGELNDYEKSYINPDCLRGLWATIDNWHMSNPEQSGRWLLLEKLNWLVPQVYSEEEGDLLVDISYSTKEMAHKLNSHFHESHRSLLIVQLDYDEQRKLWLEKQRIMVVDKYWPDFKRSQHTE